MGQDSDQSNVSQQQRVPGNRYALFLLMVIVTTATDLITKEWVFSWPGKMTGQVYWLWEGYAGFQTAFNEGALFGMGQGKVAWFAVVSLIAAIGIPAWLFIGRAASDLFLTIVLGGVLGGVLGNLYDRLGLHGEIWPAFTPKSGEPVYAVRDWILWQLNDDWQWPNFNLADSFLVVGAALLFLRVLLEPNESESKGSLATEEPSPGHSG